MKNQVQSFKRVSVWLSVVGLAAGLALGTRAYADDDMMGGMSNQNKDQTDKPDKPDMDHDHDQMKKDHAQMVNDHKNMKNQPKSDKAKTQTAKKKKQNPMNNSGMMDDDKMGPANSGSDKPGAGMSGSGGKDHM